MALSKSRKICRYCTGKTEKMLKNLAISSILVFFSLLGSAQEKGQLIAGGGFFYNSSTDVAQNITTKSRFLSISPMVGLMVSNQIATGVLLDYQIDYSKISDANFTGTSQTYSMFVGAFGRYHGRFTDKLLYTGQAYLGRTFLLKDLSTNKLESFATGVDVGLMYFIAKKAAIGIKVVGIRFEQEKDIDLDLDRKEFVIDYNVFNPKLEILFYI